jgi:23S rRNA (cytosine1962-C5)-methyltransferase
MTLSDKLTMFQNRLAKVYKHLSKQAKRQGISCYRIYDKDLPEFPLIIDIYQDTVYLNEYRAQHKLTEEEHQQWLQQSMAIIASVLQIPAHKIFLKERKRKEDRQDQYQKTGAEQQFMTVTESGLNFLVNLTDYLDTGLFLDHRITRQMLQKECAGKKVLNLFCYTASFSVYAAAAGAAMVTSVDLSKTYLNWGAENFKINNLAVNDAFAFVHADVLQYLDEIKMNSYDLIVLDPPTFSNSKRMEDILDIQRDHVNIINKCLLILKPGGAIYFSTNYTKFVLDKDAITAANITDITKATTPFDFEGKLRRFCFKIFK